MRWRGAIVTGAALLFIAAAGAVAYHRFLHIEVVRIDDRFTVLLGGGGNTAVLVADDGVLIVDTKFAHPGRELAQLVESITSKPVKVIINTHYHSDHTHGNVNYPERSGVIAQRRTRRHMIKLDRRFWEYEPGWSFLPEDLVDDEKDLEFGDEVIRVIHPGRGHTDGDVIVHFTRRGIVHTGDLFVHDRYPYIDLRAGGSGLEWPATLDAVLAIPDVKQYIPGHGPVSSRADVERFQRYLRTLVTQVEEQAARGASLREVQRRVDLRGFDFEGVPFLTTQDRNVKWVYEELQQRAER
jgi:cyclase